MNKDRNVLQLAYIGDAIYEVYIRKYLIEMGIVKVDLLQKKAVFYVSAKAQSGFLEELLSENFFNEIELEIMKRSRNHKIKHHPKNTDILTYKHATAFEAIIGYLYLENNYDRIKQIMEYIYEKTNLSNPNC